MSSTFFHTRENTFLLEQREQRLVRRPRMLRTGDLIEMCATDGERRQGIAALDARHVLRRRAVPRDVHLHALLLRARRVRQERMELRDERGARARDRARPALAHLLAVLVVERT